jgi:hypothetical protein
MLPFRLRIEAGLSLAVADSGCCLQIARPRHATRRMPALGQQQTHRIGSSFSAAPRISSSASAMPMIYVTVVELSWKACSASSTKPRAGPYTP